MKKKLLSLFLLTLLAFSVTPVFAEEAPITSSVFTVKFDVLKPERAFIPSTVKMTLSATDRTVLSEGSADPAHRKARIGTRAPAFHKRGKKG